MQSRSPIAVVDLTDFSGIPFCPPLHEPKTFFFSRISLSQETISYAGRPSKNVHPLGSSSLRRNLNLVITEDHPRAPPSMPNTNGCVNCYPNSACYLLVDPPRCPPGASAESQISGAEVTWGRGQRTGGFSGLSTKNELVSCDFVWAVR